MTACYETKRPDLTSDKGERRDESSGVAETQNVDGLASDEDGSLARLACQQSSQEVYDGTRAVGASALTIARAGTHDGGEPSTGEQRSLSENNANSNALISQDPDENAERCVSSSSSNPLSREVTWPVGGYYIIHSSVLDQSHANTTSAVTSPSSELKCCVTTPIVNTSSDTVVRNELQRAPHLDTACRGHDVTSPGLKRSDDGRQTSGACVGNENASNNFVTSHRSGSATARDNSISSPGLAGFEGETGNCNISPPIPRAVDHSPSQSAAGETRTNDEIRTTGTSTQNKLTGNNCIQCDVSIQGNGYSSDQCLDFTRGNSGKYACSTHSRASKQNDNILITESLGGNDGLNCSLQEYFISPEESCRDTCQDSTPCVSVDSHHDVFTARSTVNTHIDTEPLLSGHGQAGARNAHHDAGHGTRRQSLGKRSSEPCDTSDHYFQAHNPAYGDSRDLVQGRIQVSSIRPSNLVHPSWNVVDRPVHRCSSHNSTARPTSQEITLHAEENKQQTAGHDPYTRTIVSCNNSTQATADSTQDSAGHRHPGDSYPVSRFPIACSDLTPVTSLRASSSPREVTNQPVQTHPLIRSPPHAKAGLSDESIIGSTQARLSVSDSDRSTEVTNNVTLGITSSLDVQSFSQEHGRNTQQPLSDRQPKELPSDQTDHLARNHQHVPDNRLQENTHLVDRQSLTNANRTLSTSSEEWSDTASPSDHFFRDKESHTSSVASLEDTCTTDLQQRRRSFGRQRQVLSHNLGALSQLLREDSGHGNDPSSDDDGCDATSALLTADSDEEYPDERYVDNFGSSIGRSRHECDAVALVSKQQHSERAKDSHDKAPSGRIHFSRLVQSYCKDILRIRNNTDNSSNYNPTLPPSAYTSTAFIELNSESSREFSRASAAHINTTSSTTASPTAAVTVSSPTGNTVQIAPAAEGPSRSRGSFISGFRIQSRDRAAFLRVDHSEINSSECSSASSLHLQDGSVDPQVKTAGKRVGTGDRKKLKVEFAVMEGEGDKYIRGRSRGYGGGSFGGGVHNVKDDVENDVAMLGGGGLRFRQPRVSLLGKPLNYRAHRRDIKYRKLQSRIYNFLERPKSWESWIYHLTVFMFVLLCLTLSVLSSISEFENVLIQYAVYVEVVMLVWIMLELGLRVWSAGCRSRYQGKTGRMRFLRRPLCIIDIILSMASIATLAVGCTHDQFPQAVLSGLRFFQILRVVRLDRKGGTWKLLGSVVWAHRQELVTTLYIGLLGLVFSSYFVYLAEKDEPRHDNGALPQFNNSSLKPKFSNFADAIWWGVVTLCTVGYGDVVPATWGGKVIASFSAILGISFFALPAGILGSGFALKVQQQQRQKHLNRRRVPAANLIQSLWRCYAADEHSMSTATWKPHLIPCPSPTSERTFKNNTSFVSRFSTRRRDRSSTAGSLTSRDGIASQAQSPMSNRQGSRRAAISTSEEEVPNVLDRSHLSLATGLAEQKMQLDTLPFKKENSVSSIGKESEEETDLSPRLTQLTDQHKRAIRAIRKIRYFVARRKFREALRPYDVKDVIEQYSAGHVDMLGRIKNLQGRLDQILGRQGSKSKDVYESKVCLASRIVKVERQVEDIESKLDLLVDMYQEDRKLLMQQLQQSYSGPAQGGPSHPPPPPPAPSSQFKPRPILIDKQFTSEPATPTGLEFVTSADGRQQAVKPVIQRNLSDLSQRIKKRVTYRGLSLHDPPSRAQSAANFSSSLPPSSFLQTPQFNPPTSHEELSSRTISETRGDYSDNLISLHDIHPGEGHSFKSGVEHARPDADQPGHGDSPVSANSPPSTDEGCFFSDSNSSSGLKGLQHFHQTQMPSVSAVSALLGKTLSTLNEQRSMESDTSLSCVDTSTPSPPKKRAESALTQSGTSSESASQSPLMLPAKHLPAETANPQTNQRPHKPILRLPSAPAALTTTSPLSSTLSSQSCDDLSALPAATANSHPSNHANNISSFIIQSEGVPLLCSKDYDILQPRKDGTSARSYSTSDC